MLNASKEQKSKVLAVVVVFVVVVVVVVVVMVVVVVVTGGCGGRRGSEEEVVGFSTSMLLEADGIPIEEDGALADLSGKVPRCITAALP